MTSFLPWALGPVVGPVQGVTGADAWAMYSFAICIYASSSASGATVGSAISATQAKRPWPTKRSFDILIPPFRCWRADGSSGRVSRRFSDGRSGRRIMQAGVANRGPPLILRNATEDHDGLAQPRHHGLDRSWSMISLEKRRPLFQIASSSAPSRYASVA